MAFFLKRKDFTELSCDKNRSPYTAQVLAFKEF